MKKALTLGLIFTIFVVILVWMNTNSEKSTHTTASVGTSTFALYDIARHLLPQEYEVFMVMPFGVDIHSFEPTPKSMAQIQESHNFYYSGAGLEPWVHTFVGRNNAIDMSQYVTLNRFEDGEACDHHGDETHIHEQHENHQHATDPHYWLSLSNMKVLTSTMSEQLQKSFPDVALEIEKNAHSYLEALQSLEQKSKNMLSQCQKDEIVVNHNAFGYLAKEYGFNIHTLSGVSPDAMPSASHMSEIVDLVNREKISTIFFESFVSDRLMQTISNESGAKVDVLQPLANISDNSAQKGESYIDLYKRNMKKIAEALECH